MNQFFDYPTFQEFLRARYERLKATRPNFSARAFAKKAGIRSPSFFQMISTGKRKLTIETAERFSAALGLTTFEKTCLVTACAFERAKDAGTKKRLMETLTKLKRQAEPNVTMDKRHLAILSDPINLKLYLLAQSSASRNRPNWFKQHLPQSLSLSNVEKRIALLMDSGLWVCEGETIRTIAPTLHTGDIMQQIDLAKTHINLLEAAKLSVTEATATERVVGGRTFLFDPKRLPEIKARIDAFKATLESEFECLDSTHVYQMHLAFFELGRVE